MKKNVASQTIGAQLVSSTDGSAVTSGTTTVYVTGDGGTQATTGSATHEGNGYWSYTPSQAQTNFDHVAFTFSNTSAVSATIQVFTSFPQTKDNATDITAILADTNELQGNQGDWATATGFSTFDPSSDTVANVTLVGTCTTNTDMRGTDNALLASGYTAPDNSSITAILTDTGTTIPAQITGLNNLSSADVTAAVPTTAEIEAALINEGDGQQLIDAILQVINTNLDLPALELTAIAQAVRTELTTELGRIDANISTRLATSGYTAPANSDITAIKAKTDSLTFTVAGQVDANAESMNAAEILGDGTSANLWRGE